MRDPRRKLSLSAAGPDTGLMCSHQDPEPRHLRVCGDGCRHRAHRDPAAPAPAGRGQGAQQLQSRKPNKATAGLALKLMAVQNVPYVFVRSKAALGRACGVSRPVRHSQELS